MTPLKDGARRRLSWTKRLDKNDLPGKIAYLTGTDWVALEEGARKAGLVFTKNVGGKPTEIPDVRAYIMYLHRTYGSTSTE